MPSTVKEQSLSTGTVVQAFGNLLQVRFEGHIAQGEVAFVQVGDERLKAEVIEIQEDTAKVQVFEDTKEVQLGTKVEFQGQLLEAELGPGLLGSIFDGLQNPLEELAESAGFFLKRGLYVEALKKNTHWNFVPVAKEGAEVKRGDCLGTVLEGRFTHKIMVPFSLYGKYKLLWLADEGSYSLKDPIAKLLDAQGKEVNVEMLQRWPIKAPLMQGRRVGYSDMMDTGERIIDTQFPIMKGGTFCTPGPFGAGKTVLQHHLAKYSSVDIVIVAACGERAGEVVEVLKEFPHLTDPHTGESLMERTIIICNTSSMPVAARESSIYMGVTLAEYYRQMGLDVLLLADSTSRWAQALREMSGRLEEIPGEEAFPAYLASRIAEFYQRSGVLELPDGSQGSVTIGGAVSPAGGNFEEPVTQATLAVVGAFLGLSRARSDARRYPAIDPLMSWSKYVEKAGALLAERSEGWQESVDLAKRMIQEGDDIRKRMEVVGEEGTSIADMLIYLKAELYDNCYLQQNAFDAEDAYCPLERQIPLFSLICRIFKQHFGFKSHDVARGYFLKLSSQVKNLNFMKYGSEDYNEQMHKIDRLLEKAQGEDLE